MTTKVILVMSKLLSNMLALRKLSDSDFVMTKVILVMLKLFLNMPLLSDIKNFKSCDLKFEE